MTEDDIKSIVRSLPEDQREEAAYRIQKAHLDGVTHIGLWDHINPETDQMEVDITDLVGNCPRRKADLEKQGRFGSGLIGLSKYASK